MKRKHDDDDDDKQGKKFKVYRNAESQAERDERPPRAEGDTKFPKRKVAVLLGFCGTDYQGMQFNTGVKTIEGDIFDAFVKTGAISQGQFRRLEQSQFYESR